MARLVAAQGSFGAKGESEDVPMNCRFVNFTESGIYTVPEDVVKIHVAIVGGGAGRNAGDGHANGGDILNVLDLEVTPGETFAVLLGASVSSSNVNFPGNSSSFGPYTAAGGISQNTVNPPITKPLWPSLGDTSNAYAASPQCNALNREAVNAGAGYHASSPNVSIQARPNSGSGAAGNGGTNAFSGSGFVQIIELYKEAA